MSNLQGFFGAVLLAALLAGCATRPAIVAGPCADADLSIYFDENSADITGPAHALIADTVRHARGCAVQEVDVLGLADYRGPADANLDLSRHRAEAVARALADAGLPAPHFSIDAAGEAGSIAAPGVVEPLRRRAEVVIKYQR